MRGNVADKVTAKAAARVTFTEGDNVLPIPNLIEHQTKSWKEFKDYGLREVFEELNPIDDYAGQKMSLRFKDYYFKDPVETAKQAKDNLTTYESALHVNVELTNKVTGEVKEQDIYFGDYPEMTDKANFVKVPAVAELFHYLRQ